MTIQDVDDLRAWGEQKMGRSREQVSKKEEKLLSFTPRAIILEMNACYAELRRVEF